MKLIRSVLGAVLLFLDRVFAPRPLERIAEYQRKVDQETSKWVLYQFVACPFCIKVRRVIRSLGLKIEIKNVNENPTEAKALVEGGGSYQVPCLRIANGDGTFEWMYESSDIVRYLRERTNI